VLADSYFTKAPFRIVGQGLAVTEYRSGELLFNELLSRTLSLSRVCTGFFAYPNPQLEWHAAESVAGE